MHPSFDQAAFSRLDRARLQLRVGGWRVVVAGLRGRARYELLCLQGRTRSRALQLGLGWLDVRRLRRAFRRPPPVLVPYEASRSSQNGEDGILEAIFSSIGTTNRTLVEIGAADGEENCTRALVESGWTGLWVEADAAKAARAGVVAGDRVAVAAAPAHPDTVRGLLEAAAVPEDPDLVVLDIDGNDWWVLGALLQAVRPRVLVAEYNPTFLPGSWWVKPYDREAGWDRTFRHGASLEALAALARSRGLELVGCDSQGVNAFFVAAGEHPDGPIRPASVEEAYVPPWFSPAPWGHPRSPVGSEEMAPLAPEELARVALERPVRLTSRRCAPSQPVGMALVVRNGTGRSLTSGPGAPVHLVLRWRQAAEEGEPWGTQARHWLLWPAPPGGDQLEIVWTPAPDRPGEHVLECTLVQEGVAWLDALAGGEGQVGVAFSIGQRSRRIPSLP